MEITQADLRIGDYTSEFINASYKHEKNEDPESELNVLYTIGIKEENCFNGERNYNYIANVSDIQEPNLNSIQHETSTSSNILTESAYLDSPASVLLDEESTRTDNPADVYSRCDDRTHTTSYNISTVVITSDILDELSFSIKRESIDSKKPEQSRDESKASSRKTIIEARRASIEDFEEKERRGSIKLRRRRFRRVGLRNEYRERLRRKAECMREKRKKLYEEESQAERLQRLAREAAKRREMRMYYETPDQRRKRLDAEAARKREYRMYNETPDERRKRLDREAERRRVKRLTMYASETPEQRRERLNKESAKRREARLNQYAKETEDQRQERLRKDALRAREMRFTRSAIETEEERRERLVKDALRKRELRMHGESSVSNFTELKTVRNFEELNNVQMKDDPDNQLGGHYLSNWMMWFQNTLTHPANSEEQSEETTQQTDV